MKFYSNTGTIDILPGISLERGMTRKDVAACPTEWEDWNIIDGVPTALKTTLKLPNKNMSPQTILIVHVRPDVQSISFWDLSPRDLIAGVQNRPQGKYTKLMRQWFNEMFDTRLPCGGDWGHIDSSYDAWNQTAGIICNYRERFKDEQDLNL